MIHLTNEEYDNLLHQIDKKTEYITLCTKERNKQKQRADELEKRWEKLKKHFIKEKEQSFGMLSWSRNDGMLELMEQLEEDGE